MQYYDNILETIGDTPLVKLNKVVEGVPAKNVVNSFTVVDLGYNRSMIIFRSNFEFMENPNMSREQFEAFLKKASSEIARNYVKLANL